ncbi:MAG: tRNA (cytidine/uridine-2-O-)-methyltransferase [Clostridia bacterium]|nr:tRNA (cytidine/uridine-2-O-)-methyltransferase [Clostridia bacterium]
MPLNVVLVEPEIPQNTGNIARTCAATGAVLHLVHPLGFRLDEKHLKRAGLDYWDKVILKTHASYAAFKEAHPQGNFYFFTTKGRCFYHEVRYRDGDFLIFGPETRGLKAEILAEAGERALRVPMLPGLRSLNLANTVALVLYEALRQLGFPGMV